MSTSTLTLRLNAIAQERERAQRVARLADALLLRLRIDPHGHALSFVSALPAATTNRACLRLWVANKLLDTEGPFEVLYVELAQQLTFHLLDFQCAP